MSKQYRIFLDLFSEQLADGMIGLSGGEVEYLEMGDKQAVLTYLGYAEHGDWRVYDLRIMGTVVYGHYIGLLYDALQSVCRRTVFVDFAIHKRQGQYIRIHASINDTTRGETK